MDIIRKIMIISIPRSLSRCDDRSIPAQTNLYSGGPEDWFTEQNLSQLNIKSFSFDFFVNWRKNRFVKTLWFKRFIDISVNELVSKLDWESLIADSLFKHEGLLQLENLFHFCQEQNLNADFLIFNEQNWNEKEKIIYARLNSSSSFRIKKITLDELKYKIRLGTGKPFSIGSKGLLYSTSKLECYLSTTDTPYPGDADILLKNNDNSGYKLIEFKKHNLKTPIEDQNLSNYYPSPDWAKYTRLHILSQYLPNTQLYTLYYTTDDRHQTKIELNSFSGGKLVSDRTTVISSPVNKHDTRHILEYIKKCMSFFNGKKTI